MVKPLAEKSIKQRDALSKRRNKGLEDSVSKAPGFSCQGNVGGFIDMYLCCEVFATKIQHYYQTDSNLKKTKLNIDYLRKSLQHFNLHFDEQCLSEIFRGGEGKRSCKSARQLRNGYLHQLSEADKNEILDKHRNLSASMKKFLTLRIKT